MIDFDLNGNDAIINSDRDLVILQIEMLFDTVPGDVLGYTGYGTKYDKYLYNLKLSNTALQSIVLLDLLELDLLGYTPSVEVVLLDGSERDILLIKIDLYKDDSKIEKIYKIS